MKRRLPAVLVLGLCCLGCTGPRHRLAVANATDGLMKDVEIQCGDVVEYSCPLIEKRKVGNYRRMQWTAGSAIVRWVDPEGRQHEIAFETTEPIPESKTRITFQIRSDEESKVFIDNEDNGTASELPWSRREPWEIMSIPGLSPQE